MKGRELYLEVPGIPVPQGSMSIFNGRACHSNKHLKAWRKVITGALTDCQEPPFAGSVYAYLVFILPRPKTVARAKPCVKPDLDKLTRAVLDAAEASGVLLNDSQVCELQAVKRYVREGEDPSLSLYIRESN